jgi:hypothetical protein
MVARNDEHRHRQLRKTIGDDLVFLVEPAIGEVAAHHDAIGPRVEPQHGIHRIEKHRIGVDVAIGRLTVRSHVEVAELGNDEHVIQIHREELRPVLGRPAAA